MPTRKRVIRDEPLPQVRAQKLEHAKHSDNFSKRRNERFSVQAVRAPQSRRTSRQG